MKNKLAIKIIVIAVLAISFSSCTAKKKKKKCDTCPKWGYVYSTDLVNRA
ncbi:hypothetical protein N8289_02250 [Flavobacteriales bacterium]|jgi:hypothetical protein|nr:hypothetical protein [Flavobacteriales bacterium]MDB9701929.1 hypothetical protein [Flavobacteriales bacterium]MDB9931777.1 hypothetical protein [Flavobacteriales bacterium]MDC1370641.1 hypothetical protein [Flavobacteriales bacterium]MDG1175756.1 hypothetical protein [Flavobacteriales bacterium]